jgi:hypothetical protein
MSALYHSWKTSIIMRRMALPMARKRAAGIWAQRAAAHVALKQVAREAHPALDDGLVRGEKEAGAHQRHRRLHDKRGRAASASAVRRQGGNENRRGGADKEHRQQCYSGDSRVCIAGSQGRRGRLGCYGFGMLTIASRICA